MKKAQAKTVAVQLTPFTAAMLSLKNAGEALLDGMYGTPERTRGTMMVALLLSVLGTLLQQMALKASAFCASTGL